ncbi:MAG: GSCFA domain-containing protein [Arenibacter latericius]|nr:GSCFA domain-containing protein [Arenibacter latericius]
MKLQTYIPLDKAKGPMDYQSRVVLLGSCFSKNIGDKLDYFKFRTLCNPFGTQFHPKAIEQLVSRSIEKENYTEEDVFLHDGIWHCFDAHSDLSAASKDQLLQNLNSGLNVAFNHITKATHIIITLGTAWAYRHNATDKVVANCHKVPQKEFSKEIVSIESNVKSLRNIVEGIRSVNKKAQLIFTVSPVRHLKDGFVENQLSKANLITSIHSLLNSMEPKGHYFPSYEIMMDELRDYRFYNTDMIHPNTLAIDYIWEKFIYVWMSESVFRVMERVAKVQKGLQHRPFNLCSEQHKQFLDKQQQKIRELQKEYPFMRF